VNPISRIRAAIAARFARADKTALTNLTFVAAIALSALLLLGAGGYGWWSATLAPSVEVNGRGISKSEAKARGDIAGFKLGIEESRIRARIAAGTLTPDEGTAALQKVTDARTNLSQQLITDMVEAIAVSTLAQERGISVDDAAIEAEWAKETSTPELRLMRRITISIGIGGISVGAPSDADVAAAKQKADAIVAELAAGGDFGAIAKRDSSDSYALDGGLIGWSAQDEDPAGDAGYDAAWALTSPGTTAVIKRSTDQFVIFAVDQIRPAALDPSFEQRTSDAKLDMGVYKKLAAERALKNTLKTSVLAELTAPTVEQRDVSYVAIADDGKGDQDQIEVSHILYAPNNDARGANKLDPADPAWTAAEAEANAALAQLQAGADFATLAKGSDDASSAAQGGLLSWAPKGTYTQAFEDAIWADGLKQGDLLGPIKTEFGYHIIRFEARQQSLKFRLDLLATQLAAPGTDFETAAKAAIAGGVDDPFTGMTFTHEGWVARYTVPTDLSQMVWKLNQGEVSGVESVQNSFLIVKVETVEQRPLTEAQLTAVEGNGFVYWINDYVASAEIWVDGAKVQEKAQAVGASPQP
jgi:parvulin-like peptidyl-prolyl isomerase